jgi:hypothetical protein
VKRKRSFVSFINEIALEIVVFIINNPSNFMARRRVDNRRKKEPFDG